MDNKGKNGQNNQNPVVSQPNDYSRIFERNVNIRETMTLEMIENLFTNMNDLYYTMGLSFDSLARVMVTLYRKANQEKANYKCKECEAFKHNQENLCSEINSLKADKQSLEAKVQELQLLLQAKENQQASALATEPNLPRANFSPLLAIQPETPRENRIKPVTMTSSTILSQSSTSAVKRTSKELARMLLSSGFSDNTSEAVSQLDKSSAKTSRNVTPSKKPSKSTEGEEKTPKTKKSQSQKVSNNKSFKKRKSNAYPAKEDITPGKLIPPETITARASSSDSSDENSRKSLSLADLLENFVRGRAPEENLLRDSERSANAKPVTPSKEQVVESKAKKLLLKPKESEGAANNIPKIQENQHTPRLIEFIDEITEKINNPMSTSRKKPMNANFLLNQGSTEPKKAAEKNKSSTTTKNPQGTAPTYRKIILPVKIEKSDDETSSRSSNRKRSGSVMDKSPTIAEYFKSAKQEKDDASKEGKSNKNGNGGFECCKCKKSFETAGEGTKIDSKMYCNSCSRNRSNTHRNRSGTPEIYHHDLTLDSQP